MFTFGYGPALLNTPLAWGARGIDDGTSIGFLFDRQTWYVQGVPWDRDDMTQSVLVKVCSHHLNSGILAKVQAAFKAIRESYSLPAEERMPAGTPCETVLYEDWFMKATANTNGSCGYVYLTIAWKALPDLPIVDADPADGHLVWSCDRRPEPGSRVWVRADNAPGTVLGYAQEHGHLFAIVEVGGPLDVGAANHRGRLTNVMGREWRPLHILPDTSYETITRLDVRCGDYIVLPGHSAARPSRWVGFSSGGSVWAKHYPHTTDQDVADLAYGLPERVRGAAFAALGPDAEAQAETRRQEGRARRAERRALRAFQG